MALKYSIANSSVWIVMQATAQAGKAVQQVKEYDLFLDVDFEALEFSGKVRIDMRSTGDISLDAVGLEVTSVKTNGRTVPFKHHGNVVDVQIGQFSGILEVEYRGKVSESLTGFYKAPYGDKYVLTTHFEAGHARRLLPCIDHPAYKADFKLTVRARSDLSVISNMPVESERKEGNKKTVIFQKTPKMSTYLLYVGIGRFEEDRNSHNKTELYTASVVKPGGKMARDALKSTHPIEAKVRSPEEIEELFDEISYGKGASILRMIEAYIGPDKFQKGVSKYLQQFRYSNASGSDLWNHLQQASGMDVNHVMEGWIGKVGYPVVKASLSSGKLVLEQERFLLSGARDKQTWPIPVTIAVDGKTQQLMLDRYGLANDAWAFLNSGRMSWKEYQGLLERFFDEEDYLPAFEVSERITNLFLIAPKKVADLSRRYHKSQLKILEGKRDENSSLLRGTIAARLAILDDAYAHEASAKFKDLAAVEPDMKRSVIIGYARSSNDHDGLIDRYKKSTTDEDRLRYLEGLASFKRPEFVRKVQEFAMAGNVKRQDIGRGLLQFATSNTDAHAVTWEWFRDNIGKLDKMYEGTATLSAYMRAHIPIIGVGRVGEIEKLFGEHRLPGAHATIERLKIHDRLANEITKS